jgi:survival-of-motor-neuron-related-splicing factor 30
MPIEEYQFQLSQVNSALEKDPNNQELIKLRDGLQQLLELEQELGGAAKEIITSKPTHVKPRSSSRIMAYTELNLLEGDTVLGKWSDNNYYECLVVGRAESMEEEAYEVVFTGHESIQILPAANLRRTKANEKMPTLLTSKEVMIGEIKGKVHKPNQKFSSSNAAGGNFTQNNSSNRNVSEKKSKKNSKRDEEDKVRVNAWQSFAASKGKCAKATKLIGILLGMVVSPLCSRILLYTLTFIQLGANVTTIYWLLVE